MDARQRKQKRTTLGRNHALGAASLALAFAFASAQLVAGLQQAQQQAQQQQTQQAQQQQPLGQPLGQAQQAAPLMGRPDEHAAIHREPGKIGSASQSGSSLGAARPARHLHSGPKSFVDLSHPLHDGTLHWPKNNGFQYKSDIDAEKKSQTGESYYLKSDSFTTAVHAGTHLDAPRHFSHKGWTVSQIPLERLIDVPLTVVDLSNKVRSNRSYNFVKEDFINPITKESLVQPNSIVLVYTGVSATYEQGAKAYFGTDGKNISEMRIPGFSREAAQYLVDRQVYGVGLDAASADSSDRHGANDQYDPQAHVVFNSNNVFILENVSHRLKELVGAAQPRLSAAPLAIVNGSGSPVRLVAVLGHDECHCSSTNSALGYAAPTGLTALIVSVAYLVAVRGLAARP